MTTLLQQFRTQYPEGTLTAALVSINEGQYVVRAAVWQKGEELASGLAASVDVQIAEDKARERALAVLGMTVSPRSSTPVTPHQPATLSAAAAMTTTSVKSDPDSTAELNIVPNPNPQINPQVGPSSHPPLSPESSEAPLPSVDGLEEEDDLGPPIDSIPEEALPLSDVRPSAATIALESFNTSDTPVDLSDVIAQTDVELARLGWTNEQGRDYLDKTYGKRSRQHLTDEELMSFLLYLEEC